MGYGFKAERVVLYIDDFDTEEEGQAEIDKWSNAYECLGYVVTEIETSDEQIILYFTKMKNCMDVADKIKELDDLLVLSDGNIPLLTKSNKNYLKLMLEDLQPKIIEYKERLEKL